METGLNQLIKKALEYWDEQTEKYYKYIHSDKVELTLSTSEIKIYSKYEDESDTFFGNYEILGYYDSNTNVWVWGWVPPYHNSNETQICRELLNYGLKLEPSSNTNEHYFLKSLLVNSRISIDEDIKLHNNLAIFSYLSKKKFEFIYGKKNYLNNSKTDYATVYYLVK